MEAARLRLQARYDKDALRAEEKRQEAEDRAGDQGVGGSPDRQGLQEQVTEVCCHTNLMTKHFFRADRSSDKAREALEQQARVKGKKGFRPENNPLMEGGGGGGFR